MENCNARLKMSAYSDGEHTPSETDCIYKKIRGGVEISYNEGENKTAMRICGERVEIERSGEYSGLMVIEPEREANCCMHTPFGRTDFTVSGGKISFIQTDSGCKASFNYTSAMGGGKSQIEISLEVKIL